MEDFLEIFLLEEGGRVQKDHYVARQKESVVVITPPQPEPPTATTHRVKTRGARLAFREIFSTERVSEIASVDVGKKGKLEQPKGCTTPSRRLTCIVETTKTIE